MIATPCSETIFQRQSYATSLSSIYASQNFKQSNLYTNANHLYPHNPFNVVE